MGKWFSRQSRRAETPAEPPKKVYSWDRADRPDPKEYMYSDIEGSVVGKCPGSINGQQFLIQNCKDCAIYLFDHSAAVTIDDCVSCQIFVGPVKGSIFLRDCSQCRVMVACQQFRSRDCKKMDILLHCSSQPVIESCTKMKFGCFTASYPQLEDQFNSAGISLVGNNWSDLHDFTPASGEINWSLLDHSDFDLPNDNAELLEVGLSVEADKSLTPVTVGVAQRPQGQACLLVFLGQDHMTNVSQAIQVARQAYIKVQWNTNLWVLCRDGTMLCYVEWCIMFQLHINTLRHGHQEGAEGSHQASRVVLVQRGGHCRLRGHQRHHLPRIRAF